MKTNKLIITSINYSDCYDEFIKNESTPIYFGPDAERELKKIESKLEKNLKFNIGDNKYKIERINNRDGFGKYYLGNYRYMELYITDIENFKIN